MEITFHHSCLTFLQDIGASPSFARMIENIKSEAISAWEKRKVNENIVRFAVSIPSKYGQHFHFFTAAPHHSVRYTLNIKA